jgi:hypothetical protein
LEEKSDFASRLRKRLIPEDKWVIRNSKIARRPKAGSPPDKRQGSAVAGEGRNRL